MPIIFVPALQPPLEPSLSYTGVAATIYISDSPITIDPASVPLAINPGTVAIAEPSEPLSPAKPL